MGKLPSISLSSIERGTQQFSSYSRSLLTENIEDLIASSSQLGDVFSDTMELKESIRKYYLDENRGKSGKINLEDSIQILNDYGREYLNNLNKCYKSAQDMKKELNSSASDMKKATSSILGEKAGKELVKMLKLDYTLLITMYQEIFMIFRQGIYEHERILKMAIQGKLKPVEK